jgi:membrane protein
VVRADADDALFLAGGVAFNVLLAGIPFFLLMAAGLGYILNESPESAARIVQTTLAHLMPTPIAERGSILDPVLVDVIRTRTVVGLWSALAFLWFASRLFSSLRAVLAFVFMHGRERGYFHGKLIDLNLIFISMLLMTIWVSLSAWLLVTSGRVGEALQSVGALRDPTGQPQYVLGRLLAVLIVVIIFTALYRWLPRRRTPWRPTIVGAMAASALFEFARWLFAVFTRAYSPTSIYTGTLGAIFIVMFWTYYAALIFVLGAEVAHIEEVRLIDAGALPARPDLAGDPATTHEMRVAAASDRDLPPDPTPTV